MPADRRASARGIKAAATRRRMREAAQELFLEQGYAATSIQSIATAAGVAVQTVYFTFGTKIALLRELVDVGIAGDDDPVATLDRPWARDAVHADPPTQLRLQVAAAREITGRVAPVLLVLRGAATADPDAAALWRDNREQHRRTQHELVTALAGKGALHPHLDVGTATDIVLAIAGVESYWLLVTERGWTPGAWEDWARELLVGQLLAPPPA